MLEERILDNLYLKYEEDMQDYLLTKDVKTITKEIIKQIDELNKSVDDKVKDKIEKIYELKCERDSIENQQVFKYAFKLAVSLILECSEK